MKCASSNDCLYFNKDTNKCKQLRKCNSQIDEKIIDTANDVMSGKLSLKNCGRCYYCKDWKREVGNESKKD